MLTDVIRGKTHAETIHFVLEECCKCGVPFFMPAYLQKKLRAQPGETFYCPNGHTMVYTGKTEADKLKDQLAAEAREKEHLTNRLLDQMNMNTKLTDQLKRVHKGTCPCCNRSFANLQRHMKTKHPEIIKK